jgi:hypothetical protein
MVAAHVARMEGANHQMFRSPVVLLTYITALLTRILELYSIADAPVIPPFRDLVQFVNRQRREATRST